MKNNKCKPIVFRVHASVFWILFLTILPVFFLVAIWKWTGNDLSLADTFREGWAVFTGRD
ncbi:MAG: hypothetical protein ABSF73_03085 [Terriglobia bacterium]|jgi:hypothetical protein